MHDLEALTPSLEALAAALRRRGGSIATAESCTGGLLAAACTHLAGSSDWFDRGVVSYSNQAKTDLLGVPADLIARHGAVSEPVARAMAAGIARSARVPLALSITGVAGPGGGSADKPVGTVWLAWGGADGLQAERLQLQGDRAAIRWQTVQAALARLLAAAGGMADLPPSITT
jgi:nicotinamide-nucleotide amidase